ncbi:GlxA family transcriptional regulator [Streptomyces sp. TLI_185]|uniref:GlxA family transcriptional regulator n=1 Tax=Streptomyces sp. TLI_185 TaxID=2485151 RepID=UPI001616AB1A|nr:helix-turn-helix domain-containing protein [Streptomyces sp. TLI_185]
MNGADDSPRHHAVLIFLFEGVQSLSFSAVADVLSAANSLAGDRFRYDVRTISRDGAAVRTSSGLTVLPDCGLAGSSEADTLLVPDAHAIPVSDAESVRTLADRARRIASVGTGAFLLAEAGLLSGRRVTTHWEFSDELGRRFPDVTVDPRDTVLKDGHVTTAGGAASGLDLALSLVTEDLGRDIAQRVAQGLVTHLRKPGGQTQFAQLSVPEARSPALRQAQQQVLAHPSGEWTLRTLAQLAGLSERHISRRFRTEIGMTVREFVEQVRVTVAARLLIEGPQSPEVIARETGFGTAATMHKSFLRVVHVPPLEYRARFS